MKLLQKCCSKKYNVLDALVLQNEIGGLYDGKAWFYDIWAHFTESKARYMALELVDIHDNQSILEVAVGTGWMFSEIVQRNPNGKNIGIDISEGMLLRAKRRLLKQKNDNYSLSIGSAFKLKVEDATLDVLVNNYMFDLIPFSQMNRIMDEFNRVLKKNGQLLIINMTKGDGFGASLYESLYRFSPRLMGGCRGVNLSNLLIQHGFRIETREYVQQMLFPSEIILAYK